MPEIKILGHLLRDILLNPLRQHQYMYNVCEKKKKFSYPDPTLRTHKERMLSQKYI